MHGSEIERQLVTLPVPLSCVPVQLWDHSGDIRCQLFTRQPGNAGKAKCSPSRGIERRSMIGQVHEAVHQLWLS